MSRPPEYTLPRTIPVRAPTPPPEPTIKDLMERLARTETRLVRLLHHLGLDADGNPKK